MLTTSSSRASACRLRLLGIGLVAAALAGCTAAGLPPPERAAVTAPESPRPARAVAAQPPARPLAERDARQASPVELRAVVARRVERAEAVRLGGASFADAAREPVTLEVQTMAPLGNLERDSSPVIVLNGRILSETIPLPPDRLLVVLPDQSTFRETNTVEVLWLGDETRTRTKKPLTFRAADVR
jgi:hypothetical protein